MKVTGQLCQDPELRFTPTGRAVASFGFLNSGTTEEPAWELLNVVVWDELAERIAQYFGKGDRVELWGYEKTRTWEDYNGEKHSKQEFVVQRIRMLGRAPANG